jgi:hypothetical protein
MSIRFFASCLALTFAFATAATAAEVQSKLEVSGDQSAIWEKIGGWCAIADWHPAIAKCEEGDADGKKTRTLTTGDGAIIKETMLSSDATSYSYRIDESPLPVSNYTATFALTGGEVVWTAEFDPKGDEAEAKKVIQGIFDGGLDAIKNQL